MNEEDENKKELEKGDSLLCELMIRVREDIMDLVEEWQHDEIPTFAYLVSSLTTLLEVAKITSPNTQEYLELMALSLTGASNARNFDKKN